MSVQTEVKNLTVKRIYEETRKVVEKSIKKLEKKAKKLGVDLPEVVLGESYIHTYSDGTYEEDMFAVVEGRFKTFAIDVFDVEIKFKAIKFNGWTPIAFLDTIDKVHIQMDIDADYEYDFVEALENENCDHCNSLRPRRKVWVLQHEDGTFKKVGSTCIKDFTGVSPDSFFKMFQFIQKTITFFGDEEEMWKSCGRSRNPANYLTFDLDQIFTITKNVIGIDGSYVKSLWRDEEVGSGYSYYTKKVRSNEGDATADKVKDVLNRQTYRKEFDVEKEYFINLGTIDTGLVDGIRAYLTGIEVRTTVEKDTRYKTDENGTVQDENGNCVMETVDVVVKNEFDSKLKSFADKKRTRRFDIGFICYIVEAYNIYLDRLATPESNHIGIIGEKSILDVTIKSISGFNGNFGWTNIYKMIDVDGNVFTKFGTIADRFITDESEEIEKGTVLKFNAEIKQHNEFKGNKETVIGRVSKVPTK